MIDRRQLLKNAGALSLCSATGTVSMLTSLRALAADNSGYKALVCVFLDGGMDNYDTVLPYDIASYGGYVATRQTLMNGYRGSRSLDELLPLVPSDAAQAGSRQFAVPAELAPLHSLFGAGAVAIIGNVGPLLAPITKHDYQMSADSAPARLFSHCDQLSTWMSLQPEGATPSGWGGRFVDAEIASDANIRPAFSAVSTFGTYQFLSGEFARSYQIAPDGLPENDVLTRLDFEKHLSSSAYAMLREHFSSTGISGTNVLQRDLAAEQSRYFINNELFRSLFAGAPNFVSAFPDSDLGRQLLAIAKTIAVRDELGVSRQVFFAGKRGFDTHSGQPNTLPALQAELSQAIAAFYEAMQELGTTLDVTLFTASDFGRTLTVNGDGTDHGWGSHHFVVGGSVLGGRIYGEIPPYELGHDYDAGHGRLIPTTSIHQYAATLGRWFGLTYDELVGALPGLENFPQPYVGFL